MRLNQKLLIAGGGTGGHVLAGIAIAQLWRQRFQEYGEILFVGAKGRMEEQMVPQSGFDLKTIRLGPLNRVSFFQKLKTGVQLPGAFIYSALILMVFRPRFILGVGGYSSGPVVLTAVLLKKMRLLSVQIAILEQNSVFGFVNRLLSSKVDRIFLSFPILSQKNFDFSVPTIVTGNPIRASMKTLPPACVDPFCIFIFGGSQGSVGLNTLVLESLPYLVKFKSQLQFIHQTGEKDYERVLLEYQKTEFKYEMKKFIQDMALTYLKSSLLICRAGSSTLSELAAVGRAAILIPLPTASDNHQEMNARVFFNENAAELLIQNEATGKMLAERIIGLMKNSEKLHAIEQKVQTLNKPEAGEKILEELCLMALKST